MSVLRLDKYLSDCGVASRKEIREIIRSGRVAVDGVVETNFARKIDSGSAVALDGSAVAYEKHRYFMLNKPHGVLSATEDRDQATVLSLLLPEHKRLGLFPVGRLDKDTTGLLILTNDGDFAHKVISPKSGIMKRYLAETDGRCTEDDVRIFAEGIVLGDGTKCLPAKLEPCGERCYVTVAEGKYHQVKRMLAAVGKPVLKLHRLSVGGLLLDESLLPGQYRELDAEELCRVMKQN